MGGGAKLEATAAVCVVLHVLLVSAGCPSPASDQEAKGYGACDPESQAATRCDDGVELWVDGCGEVEGVKEVCGCGCADDTSCVARCGGEPRCDDAGVCADACQPSSCAQAGLDCGDHAGADGCGGDLSCGDCPADQRCGRDGRCVVVGCDAGLQLCGGICVDPLTDARHCGGCENPCEPGEVCAGGRCRAADDCRAHPCSGFTYCDLATGQCSPGCFTDEQCPSNEVCDTVSHTCECIDAHHRCSGVCVDSRLPAHCGERCDPCPTDPMGMATCDGSSCGIACREGTRLCAGACRECSTAGVAATACDGERCVTTACQEPSIAGEGGFFFADDGSCRATHTALVDTGSHDATLLLGEDETLQVVYLQREDAKRAVQNRGSWQGEIITGYYDEFDNLGAVLDRQGWPLLASHVGPFDKVAVTRREGDGWVQQVVVDLDLNDLVRCRAEVALDSEGTVYVVYATMQTLELYTQEGEGFLNRTIADERVRDPKILFDDTDVLHVAWCHDGAVRYRRVPIDGAWPEVEVVDDGTRYDLDYLTHALDMALDTQGRPHLSYRAYAGEDVLVHATVDGAGWRTSVVDDREEVDLYATAIALDTAGEPHIAYATRSAGLRYVRRQGASWHRMLLAAETGDSNSGNDKYDVDLVLDSLDTPHIVFKDQRLDAQLTYLTLD